MGDRNKDTVIELRNFFHVEDVVHPLNTTESSDNNTFRRYVKKTGKLFAASRSGLVTLEVFSCLGIATKNKTRI